MARKARKLSESGFYHIMFRGINHQNIFEEDDDFAYMLEILKDLKLELNFEIQAYCFMSNHAHLLLKEEKRGDISNILKRLLIKYVMKFNRKYQRSGALIESRYKSKAVEIDEYFIPLIIYIHQNPMRAGIVKNPINYLYSSYREYINGGNFVDVKLAFDLIGKEKWIKVNEQLIEQNFEVEGRLKLTEEEIRRKIKKNIQNVEPQEIESMEKAERDQILNKLKSLGLSIREIERATGISRGIIAKS